jgi:hypothetical protein
MISSNESADDVERIDRPNMIRRQDTLGDVDTVFISRVEVQDEDEWNRENPTAVTKVIIPTYDIDRCYYFNLFSHMCVQLLGRQKAPKSKRKTEGEDNYNDMESIPVHSASKVESTSLTSNEIRRSSATPPQLKKSKKK